MKFSILLLLVAACNASELFLSKLRKLSKREAIQIPFGGVSAPCGSQPVVQPYVGGMMMRPPQPQQQAIYVQNPYYQQALQYGSNCASCLSNAYTPSCYQTCSGLNNQCIVSCSPQCQNSCLSGYTPYVQAQFQPQLQPQLQYRQSRPGVY